MAPGKEKKYRRGYRRSKNWAIIFPGTPGYPFRGELGPVYPKNIAGGILRKKFRAPCGTLVFRKNISGMRVTEHGVPYILVNLILHYFRVCCVTKS